jgi:WD40 repeat protein
LRAVDYRGELTAVVFAPTGHDLLSGWTDGTVWITRDGAEPELVAKAGAAIDSVAWLSAERVVAGDDAGKLHFYDARSHASLGEVALPMPYVRLLPTRDGRRLLGIPSSGAPGYVALFDLEHRRVVARLEHHGRAFTARFIDGDRAILTAGSDSAARIWNAETGRLEKSFVDRSTYVLDAAINPQGTVVATVGGDGQLRLWDVASGRLLWHLQAHRQYVMAVRFDGSDLLTRGVDGDLARWRLPPLPSEADFVRGLDPVLRCLPTRFDDASGDLVEQDQRCGF